eukprot:Skav212457  [mRNA]  locus=scaffold385:161244:162818:+ [translate_table: standard]
MGSQHSLGSRTAPANVGQTNHSELQPFVAQVVAKMEVTHPDILRVTPAFCAFQHCAAALREGHDGDLFHHSRKSEKIPIFWSHSWHGGQWKKIITLILFYNGRAAMFFSFLAAFLVMPILYGLKVLPGFDRGLDYFQSDHLFTTWSLCSGALVASLVVVLWRPQALVFLDRICISQTDNEMKAMAIFSLAGLLRKSDSMLILWDPTWTERLWCLFELSAFLKSSQDAAKRTLIVRPIFMGPVSVTIFLTLLAFVMPLTTVPLDTSGMLEGVAYYLIPVAGAAVLGIVVGFWAVSTIRSYFRDLDLMKEQLLVISFDQARSACCEQQHVSSTGDALLCDRKVVKDIWFGSQEAFEQTVRSQVLDILTHELSENVFTTTWVLSVTSPVIWAFVDLSMSFLSEIGKAKSPWRFDFPGFLLEGLSIWLITIPNIKMLLILLCRLTRRRPQHACLEFLKNTAAVCMIMLPVLLIIACFVLSRWLVHSGLFLEYGRQMAAAAFVASMLLLSGCWWVLACALKSLLKRPGW